MVEWASNGGDGGGVSLVVKSRDSIANSTHKELLRGSRFLQPFFKQVARRYDVTLSSSLLRSLSQSLFSLRLEVVVLSLLSWQKSNP